MILNGIIFLIAFVSLTQENVDDKAAGLIFCLPIVVMGLFEADLSGWTYYLIDSALSFITINALLYLFKTKLSLALSRALMFSIFLNFVGFNMWFFYQEPGLYYVSFILFYSFVLYLLFAKGSSMWTTYCRGLRRYLGSLRFLYARTLR